MTPSTMKNKTQHILRIILPLVIWLSVWQISSMVIDHRFILPSIIDTAKELTLLLGESKFYLVTLYSLLRVVAGLVLGSLIGAFLAFASYKLPIVNTIVSPLFSVIRSTPIASIIIFLYIMLSANTLTILIAILMVAPIIWQNVLDSFNAIPADLLEVCESFEINPVTKFKILIFPTVLKFFVPALITSSSLCWKASVSAEIIAYTTKSIGQFISDAKNDLNTPRVFACTVIVIIFSILLEKLSKYLLRRCENGFDN